MPRQGSINEWHFAHEKGECSDSWHYDMSEWHMRMQGYFAPENREVVVGGAHRADILKDGVVVEFQHSSISVDEFCERNDFYINAGYRVAWVIDVADRFEEGQIKNTDCDFSTFQWLHPLKYLSAGPAPQDNDQRISICLCFTTTFAEDGQHEDGGVYKVLWTPTDDDGDPDYRHFKINGSCYIDDEFAQDMDMNLFFYNPGQLVKYYARKLPRYSVKKSGMKGQTRDTYICPITKEWIKIRNCDQCRHCGLIDHFHLAKESTGTHIYCCYPHVVRTPEGLWYEETPHPAFGCQSALRINR